MKKVFLSIFAFLIITIAILNLNHSKGEKISNLVLSNIEAIASSESGGGRWSCSLSFTCPQDGATVISCTGYSYCTSYVGSGNWWVNCDGVYSFC
jgi:hypothetical protein